VNRREFKPMPKFFCTHCGQSIDADDEFAGMTAHCPACSGSIVVPEIVSRETTLKVTKPQSLVDDVQSTKVPWPHKINTFLESNYLGATGIAWGLCIINLALGPNQGRGVFASIVQSIGALITVAVIAILIATICAFICVIFNRKFSVSFCRSYSFCIISFVCLAIAGTLLMKNARTTTRGNTSPKAEAQDANSLVTGLESDFKSLNSAITEKNGTPSQTTLRFNATKPTITDGEKVRELIQSFFNDLIGIQNDYIAEIDRSRIKSLLTPARVAADVDFIESRQMLDKARNLVSDYKDRVYRQMVSFPNRINASTLDAAAKVSALNGYKEGLNSALLLFRENWEIEESSLNLMSELFDHLEATRGLWVSKNGQILFQREPDLARFSQILGTINQGVQRQAKIRENSNKDIDSEIQKMKRTVQH